MPSTRPSMRIIKLRVCVYNSLYCGVFPLLGPGEFARSLKCFPSGYFSRVFQTMTDAVYIMSVHFIVCHHPSKAEARATVICQYPLVPGHCARKLPSRTGPLRAQVALTPRNSRLGVLRRFAGGRAAETAGADAAWAPVAAAWDDAAWADAAWADAAWGADAAWAPVAKVDTNSPAPCAACARRRWQ